MSCPCCYDMNSECTFKSDVEEEKELTEAQELELKQEVLSYVRETLLECPSFGDTIRNPAASYPADDNTEVCLYVELDDKRTAYFALEIKRVIL